jgi:phosphoribosylformylglycinamidine synthase
MTASARPAAAPGLENFNGLSADALLALSRERGLSLSTAEMTAIQAYFKTQGRPPTEAELETLAQTWSEHCKHKTFRAAVDHVEKDELGLERRREYKDLLKETIVKATDDLKRDWCLSVFKDNAGIVSYNGKDALALKVETHNHPSALEPYGGAGTGLGGVIRDILGAGLGAKPIANTDVFCFGPVGEGPAFKTGSGLSTRRVFHGVVSGVRDYGNRMGIPTVSGAVFFDEDFRDNPLVYCGTLGLMPVDTIHKEVRKGDRVVMAGGRVGRDGVHGATFSSDSLTAGIPASVVQIGNPIVEKKCMDVLLQARDRRLYRGITDCGAGGLSSAVGEMGEETGVEVDLSRVPLKYEGLAPWEIWLSESQERMVLAVPPENLKALQELFASEDVEAADIGEFTGTGRLVVRHGAELLADMEMPFLHGGCPKRRMNSFWSMPAVEPFPFPVKGKKNAADPVDALLGILSQPTVASKDWIVRQYDHEVQGRTVLKPFVGPRAAGPGDASVMMVRPDSREGVALACGINPHFSRWDPYWMAAAVLDEAVRNLVAVGARPDRIAILDNFCAGDPTDARILGEVVRAAQACHDVARAYGTPFVSGKDSFYNQFVDAKSGKKRAIPTSLLVTAMSHVDDIGKLVTSDLKRAGNWLYVVGETKDELGGSRYGIWTRENGFAGPGAALQGHVPRLNPQDAWALYEKLHEAMKQGLVAACHDCSDGGLGVALAEMALAGGLGFHVELRKAPLSRDLKEEGRTDKVLFSESNARFVVEVAPKSRKAFQSIFAGLPVTAIGQVREGGRLGVVDMKGKTLSWSLSAVEKAWSGGMTI